MGKWLDEWKERWVGRWNHLSVAILPKRPKDNEFELYVQALFRLDSLSWYW